MKKTLLLFLGLLIGFLLSEMIVRYLGHQAFVVHDIKLEFTPDAYTEVDSTLCYVSKPGKYKVNFNDNIFTESHHLEDRSRATRASYDSLDQALPSIHFYGCSHAYGTNLSDSMTMAWKTQTAFLDEYDVKNFAVGGYGVNQMYLQIKNMIEQGGKLPELVIINYAAFHNGRNVLSRARRKELVPYIAKEKRMNDLKWPVFSIKEEQLNLGYKKLEYKYWPLQEQSALIHLLEKTYNEESRDKEEEKKISLLLLTEIDKISREHNINCLIAGINNSNKTKETLSILSEKNIEVLDISVDLSLKENNLMPYDRHPSGFANSQFAEKIIEYISSQQK